LPSSRFFGDFHTALQPRYAYEKAAAKLRQDILRGRLRPSERLPGERDLCSSLGVSRITVRLALDLLAEEELVVRRQGSGTYVSASPRPVLPLGINYSGSVREHAPELRRRLVSSAMSNIREFPWASDLLPPETPVLAVVRIDSLRRTPVAWDCGLLADRGAVHAMPQADLASLDFTERWIKAGMLDMITFDQTVTAVAAEAADAKHLGIKRGAPLLQTIEIFSCRKGVAGVFLSRYRPAHIHLRGRCDFPPGRPEPRTRAPAKMS
jgi:DNA-binding GntR family transcriptional regulator